jgi:hypothetical protein
MMDLFDLWTTLFKKTTYLDIMEAIYIVTRGEKTPISTKVGMGTHLQTSTSWNKSIRTHEKTYHERT